MSKSEILAALKAFEAKLDDHHASLNQSLEQFTSTLISRLDDLSSLISGSKKAETDFSLCGSANIISGISVRQAIQYPPLDTSLSYIGTSPTLYSVTDELKQDVRILSVGSVKSLVENEVFGEMPDSKLDNVQLKVFDEMPNSEMNKKSQTEIVDSKLIFVIPKALEKDVKDNVINEKQNQTQHDDAKDALLVRKILGEDVLPQEYVVLDEMTTSITVFFEKNWKLTYFEGGFSYVLSFFRPMVKNNSFIFDPGGGCCGGLLGQQQQKMVLLGGKEDWSALATSEDSSKRLEIPELPYGPTLKRSQVHSAFYSFVAWVYECCRLVLSSSIEHQKTNTFFSREVLSVTSRRKPMRQRSGPRLDNKYAEAEIHELIFFKIVASDWKSKSYAYVGKENSVLLNLNLPNGTNMWRRDVLFDGYVSSNCVEEILWYKNTEICGITRQPCGGVVSDKFKAKAMRNLRNRQHWMVNTCFQVSRSIKDFGTGLPLSTNMIENGLKYANFISIKFQIWQGDILILNVTAGQLNALWCEINKPKFQAQLQVQLNEIHSNRKDIGTILRTKSTWEDTTGVIAMLTISYVPPPLTNIFPLHWTRPPDGWINSRRGVIRTYVLMLSLFRDRLLIGFTKCICVTTLRTRWFLRGWE